MYDPTAYASLALQLEKKAQEHANATWFWGIAAAAVWYFWSAWGAALLAVAGVACAYSSVTCTRKAGALRKLLAPPDLDNL